MVKRLLRWPFSKTWRPNIGDALPINGKTYHIASIVWSDVGEIDLHLIEHKRWKRRNDVQWEPLVKGVRSGRGNLSELLPLRKT